MSEPKAVVKRASSSLPFMNSLLVLRVFLDAHKQTGAHKEQNEQCKSDLQHCYIKFGSNLSAKGDETSRSPSYTYWHTVWIFGKSLIYQQGGAAGVMHTKRFCDHGID